MDAISSGDSVLRLAYYLATSSISWWALLLLLSLFLMERFDLGTHSLPWKLWRKDTKMWCSYDSVDGGYRSGGMRNGNTQHNGGCVNGIERTPSIFHDFILSKVIPTFQMQRRDDNNRFAVLAFTHLKSLHDIRDLAFKQITFNGKPLVDPRLPTYPETYRLENYIVTRETQSKHPEVLIAKQIPALLSAFGKAERCHMRSPAPKMCVLYCSAMPCAECTRELISSLTGVCRNRTVLAYSQEDTDSKEGIVNRQHLTNAGISVIKINS